MILRIYHNGTTLINDDYIYKVHYKRQCYDDKFFLGATPCREITLEIDRQAFNTQPTTFQLRLYNGTTETTICTVYVDDVDTTNDYYYTYKCLDAMVKFNTDMVFSVDTVANLLTTICRNHGLGEPMINANIYPFNMTISWSDYCTEREFISYVAELQAGVAYINNGNRLTFDRANNVFGPLLGENMADITVGVQHRYTRIVWDSVAHYETGTTDGETLYLNTNNILFADGASSSTRYNTIQKQVNWVGNYLFNNGEFVFNNIQSSNIVVPDNVITYSPGARFRIVVDGMPEYYTFIEPDYYFNNGNWIGGINVQLKTQEQEETEVIDNSTVRAINAVNVKIDRQAGTIDLMGQRIDDTEETLVHFQVNSAAGEVRVTNQTTNPPTSYTAFRGDGMRVYVDGQLVAEATASRFECDKGLGVQDWAIEHGDDAAVLMIYRRQ